MRRLLPCSQCGSHGFGAGCPRCEEARIACESEESLALFEQEEAIRMNRTNPSPACRDRLPLHVALVGCSSHKRWSYGALPAKDLYTGRFFKQGFRYAQDTADDVLILSGLHGLVEPHRVIEPYDFHLALQLPDYKSSWGGRVVGQLLGAYPLVHLVITFYAGREYVDPVVATAREENVPWEFETPLKGLDLFQRIQWFKEHLHDGGCAC